MRRQTPLRPGRPPHGRIIIYWKMCRTCHRIGTRALSPVDRCTHPVEAVGICGQCGKKRPLVTCHRYDFRGLRSGAPHRTTAIRTQNPERQAKRRQRQAAKHRAYMRSETRKIVDERAAGRCETAVRTDAGQFEVEVPSFFFNAAGWFHIHLRCESWQRCENKAVAHHHLTYFRYGGDELPEDMLKVCRRCHEWLERQDHPTRRSHLRQTGRARQETENG